MESKLSKLQIRAKVLSFLENGEKDILQNRASLERIVEDLRKSARSEDLLEILLKEFSNNDMQNYELLSYLLMEFGSLETLREPLWSIITEPKYNDMTKEMASLILRDLGEKLDFDDITQYFNNPDEIVDIHTQKLLETAFCNPESQVDFLDFLYSLPEQDKIALINSLKGGYDGDYIANIFSPILEANSESEEIQSLIIDILGTTKSVNALKALNLIYQKSQNPTLSHYAKKSLSLLKLSGVDFDNYGKYINQIICKDSKLFKCYATIPDGLDYQGIIVTRKREDKSIQMMAVVVQADDGIVDSFGFNRIEEDEMEKIIEKFTNDDKCYEVSAQYCKFLFEQAYSTSIKQNKAISYEYVCWKVLLDDAEKLDVDFNKIFSSEFSKLNQNDYDLMFKSDIFDNWFYEEGMQASKLFEGIRNTLCTNENRYFTSNVEKLMDQNSDTIFNEHELEIIYKRLLFTALILEYQPNKILKESVIKLAWNLKNNKKDVEPFLTLMLQNTVYQYLLTLKESNESKKKTKNIFSLKKQQEKVNEFSVKSSVLKKVIGLLETDWNIHE